MQLRICIYTCTHSCIYAYQHTRTHTYTHTHIYIYTHTGLYIYIYIYIYIYRHVVKCLCQRAIRRRLRTHSDATGLGPDSFHRTMSAQTFETSGPRLVHGSSARRRWVKCRTKVCMYVCMHLCIHVLAYVLTCRHVCVGVYAYKYVNVNVWEINHKFQARSGGQPYLAQFARSKTEVIEFFSMYTGISASAWGSCVVCIFVSTSDETLMSCCIRSVVGLLRYMDTHKICTRHARTAGFGCSTIC